ncbi:hypothetical protein PP713_14055 [Mycobacterium sp. CSUR Q5927]|nr:hypothetical protein [Mycobacterium sp. CSUR Q5927]
MTVIGAAVDPLIAVKAYLDEQLSARGNDIHIGVVAPKGTPERYVLLGTGGSYAIRQQGTSGNRFVTDHMVDIIVYDSDAIRLAATTNLILAIVTAISNVPVNTAQGRTHLITGILDFTPIDYPDPDVPLHGRRMAVRFLMSNSVL